MLLKRLTASSIVSAKTLLAAAEAAAKEMGCTLAHFISFRARKQKRFQRQCIVTQKILRRRGPVVVADRTG